MNELPRDAQALLNLTRDAHDPPDERARQRMQARLAALALLPPVANTLSFPPVPATGAATGAGATGWLAASKALLAGVMALSLGGGLFLLSRESTRVDGAQTSSAPAAQPAPAGVTGAQPSPEPSAAVAQGDVFSAPSPTPSAPVLAPSERTATATAPRASSPRSARAELISVRAPSSLHEEMALLRRATEQLAHSEIGAALASIAEHQRRFEHSQLSEEREGLRVLAHCLRGPSEARGQAKAYIARAPASVLVTRVVSACDL